LETVISTYGFVAEPVWWQIVVLPALAFVFACPGGVVAARVLAAAGLELLAAPLLSELQPPDEDELDLSLPVGCPGLPGGPFG
jgi:hypothetical protein